MRKIGPRLQAIQSIESMGTLVKAKFVLITGAMSLTLAACGNAKDKEAKRLGFSDASEMEEVQSKGWHTNAQYVADETKRAERFGFITIDELHRADQAGVKTKAEYDKYRSDLDAKNAKFLKEEEAKEKAENEAKLKAEAAAAADAGGSGRGQSDGSSRNLLDRFFGGSSTTDVQPQPANPGLATRALSPGSSTGADFEKWKEAGSTDYDETWLRYPISSVNTDYTGRTLTYLHVKLYKSPDSRKGQVLPSFNNIKVDIAKWCGTNWKSIGSSNSGRVAESDKWSCEVDMPTDGSGPEVWIMKRGQRK